MRLVEQHIIKRSSVYYNELQDLLHKCKNLYNKGLYVVRQYYFQYNDDNTVKYKYLNYYSLEKKLRTENDVDYRALPSSVAQQVLINHVVSNGINTIVIGHNKCWKQEINIGKRNNQNFVSIPFNMFISMISYKATLEGINVKIVEESYTSKCSFLDNEQIRKHEEYVGRRIKRGLFKTSSGNIINADINAVFNIIRKSAKEAFDVSTLPEGRGFWWNPVRISV